MNIKFGYTSCGHAAALLVVLFTAAVCMSVGHADELRIVSASYGARDRWVDVTEKVRSLAQGGTLTVKSDTQLAGRDPIFGQVKELKIVYQFGGKQYFIHIREGDQATIPSSSAIRMAPNNQAAEPNPAQPTTHVQTMPTATSPAPLPQKAAPEFAATSAIPISTPQPNSDPLPVLGPPSAPPEFFQKVDLQELRKNPKEWPTEVELVKPTQFPAPSDNKPAATTDMPRGTKAKLLEVLGEALKVACGKTVATIPADATDLSTRILAQRSLDQKHTVTVYGQRLTSISAVNVEPSGEIAVKHSAGWASCAPSAFPSDFLSRWGWTPETIKKQLAFVKPKTEAKQWPNATKRFAETGNVSYPAASDGSGKVFQVTDQGLLINEFNFGQQIVFLVGHPRQNELVDGDWISFLYVPAGRYTYKTVLGAGSTILKLRYAGEPPPRQRDPHLDAIMKKYRRD